MRSDYDLIVHKYNQPNNMIVFPISDVHLGSKEHLTGEWDAFTKMILSQDNYYITLGGDLINNATRTSVSNIFDDTMRPSEQKKVMAEMLRPIVDAGRILCAVSGNHEQRSGKDVDDDPMYDIMCKLDLEDIYRENAAFVKIQCGAKRAAGTANPTYCLAVLHGAGGGIYTGASVNRTERFGYYVDGLDALIVGHTHKPAVTKPNKIYIDKHNNKVSIKPFVVVTSSSWQSYGGYAMRKMLQPSSAGDPQALELYRHSKNIKISW